jgi:serine/threonine protein kinase
MAFGIPPFYDQNVRRGSLEKLSLNELDFPTETVSVSNELKDLLRLLLNPNPRERLGWKEGIQEIKNHSWFRKITLQAAETSMTSIPGRITPQTERTIQSSASFELNIDWACLSSTNKRAFVESQLSQVVLDNLQDEASALLGRFTV